MARALCDAAWIVPGPSCMDTAEYLVMTDNHEDDPDDEDGTATCEGHLAPLVRRLLADAPAARLLVDPL